MEAVNNELNSFNEFAEVGAEKPSADSFPSSAAAPDTPLEQDAEMRRLFGSQAALIYRLTSLLGLSLIVILILALGCAYLWWRSPEVITWKESASGDKTLLMINNREYGDIQNLSMRPQGESAAEKIFAAKELTRLLYAIDPDTRQSALQRVFNWFPDDAARTRDAFAAALKQIGSDPNACIAVQLESNQKWQSVFTIQEAGVAQENPALVRILGTQRLRRTLLSNNVENRLLSIDMELIATGTRTEQNLMTGYEPKYISCKVLQTQTSAESPQATNGNVSATQSNVPVVTAQPPPAANSNTASSPNR